MEQTPGGRRDEFAHVAALHLFRQVAEKTSGRRVDREQRPREVLRVDEALAMFNQVPVTAFTRPQCLRGALALGQCLI